MRFCRTPLESWGLLLLVAATLVTALGCGSSEPPEQDELDECETVDDCDDDYQCVADRCTSSPDEGADCPTQLDGQRHDDLECHDGTWESLVCDEDDDCFDEYVCIEQSCGQTPEEGLDCSEYDDGASWGDYVCSEGTWELIECEDHDDCGDEQACLHHACNDEPTDGQECPDEYHGLEYDGGYVDLVCVDNEWQESSWIDDPTIDSITIDPSPVPQGETATVTADATDPYDLELHYEWSVQDAGWEIEGDGETAELQVPDSPGAYTTVELKIETDPGSEAEDSQRAHVEVVDGDCAPDETPFGGGDGDATAPWLICSADQLRRIDDEPEHLEASFRLASDIDFAEVDDFEPIGDSFDPFSGDLFGDGHTLQNWSFEGSGEPQVFGLFYEIDHGSLIQNFNIDDFDLQVQGETVGSVAGKNYGTIEDVEVSGQLTLEGEVAGGIVGNNQQGVVRGTDADVVIDVDGWYAGGIAGHSHGDVFDSQSTGHIDAERAAGGLIGNVGGDIARSQSSASVTVEASRGGGLVGQTTGSDGSIWRSYATGDVEGGARVAGFAGETATMTSISTSFATGDVTGRSTVGGFVGYHGGGFSEVYSTGHVDPEDEDPDGGLVSSLTFTGGNHGNVSRSYWDLETSGTDESADGEGLETDEFADPDSFDDWNFDEVWEIGTDDADDERPRLQWATP